LNRVGRIVRGHEAEGETCGRIVWRCGQARVRMGVVGGVNGEVPEEAGLSIVAEFYLD
jgi:galactokinase